MPIDWTKLNTIFKKANKRYPNVPSIDGKTESHTQALLQIKEALDIAQRRSGDIRDSFVRVGELEDLGLFDNLYLGKNVGTGAGIYKRTDESQQLKYHELRSLVAGDGIDIERTANEIIISATSGDATRRAGARQITAVRPPCSDTSISIVPQTLAPDAQEGDLAVWIVFWSSTTNSNSISGYSGITCPTGWSILQHPNTGMAIFYKFLTAADLSATHTITETVNHVRYMCSKFFAYRDVNRELPFGGYVALQATSTDSGRYSAYAGSPIPVFVEGQQIIQGVYVRAPNTTAKWALSNSDWQTGEYAPADVTEDNFGPFLMSNSSNVTHNWHLATFPASVAADYNLIPGEGRNNGFSSTAGWSFVRSTHGPRTGVESSVFSTLTGGSGGESYAECELDLVEGQDYTFSYAVVFSSSTGGCAISLIDDLGQRRAVAFDKADTSLSPSFYIDHPGDRNVNWRGGKIGHSEDGVPSQSGAWCTIWFRCPRTARYKFRINPLATNVTTEAGFASSSASTVLYISHILARNGLSAPYPSYTYDDGTPDSSDRTFYTPPRGWVGPAIDSLDLNTGYRAYSINPNWANLPLATFSGNVTDVPLASGVAWIDTDGSTKTRQPCYLTDDNYYNVLLCTRAIFPTKEGSPGRYYFEVKFDEIGPGTQVVGVTPFGNPFEGMANFSGQYAGYRWVNTQVIDTTGTVVATPGAIVLNDIIGVGIDYASSQVLFYRNGTLVATCTMPDGYPGTGAANTQYEKDVPLVAYASAGGDDAITTTYGRMTIRLKEPFTYTIPAGFVEYDWAGNKDVTQYSPNVGNGGNGAFISYADADGNQIMRSLLAGTGISLTTFTEEIRIDATPTLAQNLGGGAKVFGSLTNYTMNFKTIRANDIYGLSGLEITETPSEILIDVIPSIIASQISINDLLDVDEAYPNTNDFLQWNGSAWVGGGLSINSNVITDVNINNGSLSMGQVLTWNGSRWVNAAPTGGGGGGGGGSGASYLNDLLDVYCPYPNPGDALVWTGYDWQSTPVRFTLDELLNVNAPSPSDKSFLQYDGASSEWKQRSQLDAGITLTKVKSANEDRVSTTAMAVDSELFFDLDVGTYIFELQVYMQVLATPDAKIGMAFDGTSSSQKWRLEWFTANVATGVTAQSSVWYETINTITAWTVSATSQVNGKIKGVINVTAPGRLGVQWAQNTSNASATTMKSNSWMQVTKVVS